MSGYSLKKGVLGVKIQKFCVLRAEMFAKTRGTHERRIDGKLVGWRAPTGLKKGVMTAAHYRTTFQWYCLPGVIHMELSHKIIIFVYFWKLQCHDTHVYDLLKANTLKMTLDKLLFDKNIIIESYITISRVMSCCLVVSASWCYGCLRVIDPDSIPGGGHSHMSADIICLHYDPSF